MTTTRDKLPFFPLATFPFSVIIDTPYITDRHNEQNYTQETLQHMTVQNRRKA
jgi:hypothetical protein